MLSCITTAVRYRPVDDTLLNFSIHSLPLEEQALFQTILLIPIGALVVVFLRIWWGSRPLVRSCRCSLPWRSSTSLLTGLIGFLLVVAVGW